MLVICFTKVRGFFFSSVFIFLIASVFFLVEGSFEAAEHHFLASGKRDSARLLSEMFLQWAEPTGEYGVFAIRGVIPYVSWKMLPFSIHLFLFLLGV